MLKLRYFEVRNFGIDRYLNEILTFKNAIFCHNRAMFLPLGFGGRFPSLPWFTLILSALLWLIHDSHGKKLMAAMEKNFDEQISAFMSSKGAYEAASSLCRSKETPSFIPRDERANFAIVRSKTCSSFLENENLARPWNENERLLFGYLLHLHIQKKVIPHAEFVLAADTFSRNIASFIRDHGLLSKDTVSLKTVLYSTLLHGDWSHLFSNILFLLLVGCLVELRRSSLMAGLVFFVGGGLGALAHFFFVKDHSAALVGASGGIFALAGLFTAYFWRFRMKFLFFVVPPFYRTFHANALLILPLSFFVREFISGVNSIALGGSGDVAHWAHLGGFVFGLGVGLVQERMNPIEWPFLYAGEKEKLDAILSLSNPHERIHECNNLLKYNPENMYAVEKIIDDILTLLNQGHPLTPELKNTLKQHLPTLISVYQRRGQADKAFRHVPKIPLSLPLSEVLDRSSQSNLMSLIRWSERHNLPWTLLRAYDLWLTRFANSNKLAQSYGVVESILNTLPSDSKTIIRLDTFLRSSHKSPFLTLYRSKLDALLGHRKIHQTLEDFERKNIA
jgi:membrane associated rhomboid family serine protease